MTDGLHLVDGKAMTRLGEISSITLKKINLRNYKIRNLAQEELASYNIISEALGWIKDSGYTRVLSSKSISMLVNKIVYFSSRDLGLKITRGWYKYGPCYEKGRMPESLGVDMITGLIPSQTITKEVEAVCQEHVPIFNKGLEEDYPYEYLKYIYENKNDFSTLKEFYIKKHELAYVLQNLSKNYETAKESELVEFDKKMFDFEQVITDEDYYNKVNIAKNQLSDYLDYTMSIRRLLTDSITNKNSSNKILVTKISREFINLGLAFFAEKNYVYSLTSFSDKHKTNILRSQNSNSTSVEIAVRNTIADYYKYYKISQVYS